MPFTPEPLLHIRLITRYFPSLSLHAASFTAGLDELITPLFRAMLMSAPRRCHLRR